MKYNLQDNIIYKYCAIDIGYARFYEYQLKNKLFIY